MHEGTFAAGASGTGAYATLADLIGLRHQAHRLSLPRNQTATNPMNGQLRSKHQGRGMDFSEVRLYQPGDDIRSIDWKVTARTSKTHTKVFQEERERPVLILVDQGPSLYFGSRVRFKSVAAVRLAALLGWAALDQGDRVGGIVFNDQTHLETRPRRSRKSLLRLIHDCLSFNHRLGEPEHAQPHNHFSDMIMAAQRTSRHGSLIFIISDFSSFGPDLETRLNQLGRHNDLHGIQVVDPLDRELPAPGRYSITDGIGIQEIDTRSRHARSRHIAQFEARTTQVQRAFQKVQGRFTQVAAFEQPDDYLPQFFDQRGGV
ncbi:MAG: DUF58 domain-containing protein [Pseudomonadales bacterium]|jgi:uncharacterized protein (DUF58 family)|tara:strand:+ start:1366 stop:2316 length:951 start_codon:yes stop_codon:yes gene_type:complete